MVWNKASQGAMNNNNACFFGTLVREIVSQYELLGELETPKRDLLGLEAGLFHFFLWRQPANAETSFGEVRHFLGLDE